MTRLWNNFIYLFIPIIGRLLMIIAMQRESCAFQSRVKTIEGCAHGELERIYDTLALLEQKENVKIDLLLCCGDFQAVRNQDDLNCLAVPQKYREMGTFHKYYSGEKEAPILTIFIGGNHEASNYLQEMPYGGWAAPNIYYLGYAGCVNVAGIRIAGLSGIYKGRDFMKGHYEKPPYSEDTKRSVYHIRNLDVFRLKQLQQPIDIFLSHDWPRGVYHFGDVDKLLRAKPFFKEEVLTNSLGSAPSQELLSVLKPKFWFAAHLHVKFPAIVTHTVTDEEGDKPVGVTKFLALDKCLPRRHFLQVVDVPHNSEQPIKLSYDPEWLAILLLTNHLLSVKATTQYMPGPGGTDRYIFNPTAEEIDAAKARFEDDLLIPLNFEQTVPPHDPTGHPASRPPRYSIGPNVNPQTTTFCESLGIDDPMVLIGGVRGVGSPFIAKPRGDDEEETGEETDDGPSSLWSISTSGTPSRSSLVLPSPKLTEDEQEQEMEKPKEPSKETFEPPRITEDEEDSSAQNMNESSIPSVKRFKRRNYNLYQCGSEDD